MSDILVDINVSDGMCCLHLQDIYPKVGVGRFLHDSYTALPQRELQASQDRTKA
jgi:hypothetical protein